MGKLGEDGEALRGSEPIRATVCDQDEGWEEDGCREDVLAARWRRLSVMMGDYHSSRVKATDLMREKYDDKSSEAD
jgi:hypothetical protein